jgi:2-methylcitrate dehydratase PrpD
LKPAPSVPTVSTSPTQELADFVAAVRSEDLPDELFEQARKLTLDAIGCALLGSRMDVAPVLVKVLGGVSEAPEAIVLGRGGERRSRIAAAMVNVGFVHQTELGEGVSRATVHTSTVVVPAALALAESNQVTGLEFLRAVILGSEVFIRFGYAASSDPANKDQAAGHGDHAVAMLKGFAPIAGLAPLASATVAGSLGRFGGDLLHRAWGVAVCLCPMTPVSIIHEGSTGKGAFCGIATASGLLSAQLAAEGLTGISGIVDTWFPMWLPAFDATKLNRSLGEHYEYSVVGYKYLASIGPTHAALLATFQILDECGPIDPDDIDDILIEAYNRVLFFYSPPPATSPESVKTSVAACVAEALISQRPGAFIRDAFLPESYLDPRRVELSKKVRIVVNPDYERLYPLHGAKARVHLRLRDGRVLVREVDRDAIPRKHYPQRSEIEDKFRASTEGIVDRETADAIINEVWDLGSSRDIDDLIRLLATV